MSLRALAALFALGLLSGCNKPPQTEPAPIHPVLSMLIEQSESRDLTLAGTVQPRVQTNFAFRVLGRITSRQVNVSDIVEKGQTLAVIDPIALKLAVRSAEADLSNAQAQLANASGVAQRQAALMKTNATTQAQFDAAVQAEASAQSAFTRAQSTVTKSREQLGYAVLTSDFAGVVTSVSAEVGQIVSPGQTVVTVAEPGARDAVIDVPDALVGALAIGGRFKVALQLDAALQTEGAIREIAPEADAATRTRRVKIALENPPQTFRLGSTITASLGFGEAAFVRLPVSALLEKDGKSEVWIVDPKSKTVSTHEVSVKKNDDGFIDVVSGLEPSMRVVTAGVHSLAEGQSVKIEGDDLP